MNAKPFPRNQLPSFKGIVPTRVPEVIRGLLDKNRQTLANLLAQNQVPTWDNLMRPLEEQEDLLHRTWSPVAHLHAVMETEELRKAYHETLPLLTAYHTELTQNEKLFQAVTAIALHPDFAKLHPAQRKIIENDLRDFKLAGIHLSAEKKARFLALQQELSRLTTQFSENLLDATQAWVLPVANQEELAGLPAQVLQLAADNAKQRNLTGYVLTLDYPCYSAAIKYLHNRELRKTLYTAYVTRASDVGPYAGRWDNTAIMDAILKCRHEIANIVGFANYAEYSLATKMAKTSRQVLDFLHDLLRRSKPLAEKEYQDIVKLAQSLDGITDLAAWDVPYYSEKLQEATFHFSPEDLRPYFPVPTVLQGMFDIVNKIYGLCIQQESHVEVWHPDVTFFSVYDQNNVLRGGFYIDLYARLHKREGAWMDDCCARRLTANGVQVPVAFLTCNFMPPVGDQPGLLTHDDVLTLFHEFGHCLHHMLTKVDYPAVGGIHGVLWDVVELPSQFMENFCWEKEALALIAKHYQTGAALPDELYQKMLKAKHFQTGLQMIRQIEFSLFDFCLHLTYQPGVSQQPQAMLDEIRQLTAVIPVTAFNRFQHSFAHIFAGGYAAGYYSYKWAEVLSADAYAQFEEQGIFDPMTGRAFMENILEIGGTRDPLDAFIAFRGRPPAIDALLRHSGVTIK